MPFPTDPTTLFTSPQEAAAAFYKAFESGDLDAMMAVWAEDDEVACVHPGGPRVVGYDAVRGAWDALFRTDTRLKFALLGEFFLAGVSLAVQSVLEQVQVANEPKPRGLVVATNVFSRTPEGWRLVMHHASPAPAREAASAPAPGRPLH